MPYFKYCSLDSIIYWMCFLIVVNQSTVCRIGSNSISQNKNSLFAFTIGRKGSVISYSSGGMNNINLRNTISKMYMNSKIHVRALIL